MSMKKNRNYIIEQWILTIVILMFVLLLLNKFNIGIVIAYSILSLFGLMYGKIDVKK